MKLLYSRYLIHQRKSCFRFFEKRGEKEIVCLVPDGKKPGRNSYHSENLRAHSKAKHNEQFQFVERLSNFNDYSYNSEEDRYITSNSSLAAKILKPIIRQFC